MFLFRPKQFTFAELFEFYLVTPSRMNFLEKKNLLEAMNVAVDVLLEIGHAPAPVDQEQSCREKSAELAFLNVYGAPESITRN